MTNNKNNVKTCPFCGGTPNIATKTLDNNKVYYKVICENPDCIKNRQWNSNISNAVTGWNIRYNEF